MNLAFRPRGMFSTNSDVHHGLLDELALMHGFHRVEASKVFCIECKNTPHAVGVHRGDEAGIMHLNAADAIGHQQMTPFRMNARVIRKEDKCRLDLSCAEIRLFRR